VDEHEAQLELADDELDESADFAQEYFCFPTLETSFLAFFDLHFGHTVLGFSLRLKVTTSNCFLHLSH
jgi:hypothetical protein